MESKEEVVGESCPVKGWAVFVKRGKKFVQIGYDKSNSMTVSEHYRWLTGHDPAQYDRIEDIQRHVKAIC